MHQGYFKIEFDVNAPDTVNVDEKYEYRLNLTLIGDPGISEIHASFYTLWDSYGERIPEPIKYFVLEKIKPNDSQSKTFSSRHRMAGIESIVLDDIYVIRDGIRYQTNLFSSKDGSEIVREQAFHTVRVCSMEEILQSRLIEALEGSSKSQDRLAKAEVVFAAVAAFFTLVQIYLALR